MTASADRLVDDEWMRQLAAERRRQRVAVISGRPVVVQYGKEAKPSSQPIPGQPPPLRAEWRELVDAYLAGTAEFERAMQRQFPSHRSRRSRRAIANRRVRQLLRGDLGG